MEIFNVHLLELVMIAGLALVVFGPERLPEMGRFAGKQVARFLAWQQQSPELQMVNEMRAEFEQEIAQLRAELSQTQKQLDVSKPGQALTEQFKQGLAEVRTTLDQAATPVIRPPTTAPVPAAGQAVAAGSTPAVTSTAPVLKIDDIPSVPAAVDASADSAADGAAARPAVVSDDQDELTARVVRLTTDLQQLVLDLQQRGLLQHDWQASVGRAEEQTTL